MLFFFFFFFFLNLIFSDIGLIGEREKVSNSTKKYFWQKLTFFTKLFLLAFFFSSCSHAYFTMKIYKLCRFYCPKCNGFYRNVITEQTLYIKLRHMLLCLFIYFFVCFSLLTTDWQKKMNIFPCFNKLKLIPITNCINTQKYINNYRVYIFSSYIWIIQHCKKF